MPRLSAFSLPQLAKAAIARDPRNRGAILVGAAVLTARWLIGLGTCTLEVTVLAEPGTVALGLVVLPPAEAEPNCTARARGSTALAKKWSPGPAVRGWRRPRLRQHPRPDP